MREETIEMDLDSIPRTVLIPSGEIYAMVTPMELEQIARGTSPHREITIGCITVFISTMPGSIPALRAAVLQQAIYADDFVFALFACTSLILGVVCGILWHAQWRRQKVLIDKILSRRSVKTTPKIELRYPEPL